MIFSGLQKRSVVGVGQVTVHSVKPSEPKRQVQMQAPNPKLNENLITTMKRFLLIIGRV